MRDPRVLRQIPFLVSCSPLAVLLVVLLLLKLLMIYLLALSRLLFLSAVQSITVHAILCAPDG
jgi:hypothetical protein